MKAVTATVPAVRWTQYVDYGKRGASIGMSEQRRIRVLLVDNSTYRAGLRQEIERHSAVVVVGEADTAREAIALVTDKRPDVVVADLSLPDGSGIELCRYLVEEVPGIQVLITSSFDWDVYLASTWEAGAVGMMYRSAPTSELVRGIIAAASDLIYTPSQITRVRAWGRSIGEHLQTLSAREWVILRYVASGRTNREISQDLGIAEHTVEKHLTALHQKFHVTSRTALLALILRYHLEHLTSIGQMADFRHSPMTEIRHSPMTDFRHSPIAEIRHTSMAEIRHLSMAEIRHPEMTEIRDDTTEEPLSSDKEPLDSSPVIVGGFARAGQPLERGANNPTPAITVASASFAGSANLRRTGSRLIDAARPAAMPPRLNTATDARRGRRRGRFNRREGPTRVGRLCPDTPLRGKAPGTFPRRKV